MTSPLGYKENSARSSSCVEGGRVGKGLEYSSGCDYASDSSGCEHSWGQNNSIYSLLKNSRIIFMELSMMEPPHHQLPLVLAKLSPTW